MIDKIVLLIIILFTLSGFIKGFRRIVFDSLPLAITLIGCIIYYKNTHRLLTTFIVFIVALIVLSITKGLINLAIANKEKSREKFFSLNRIGGLILGCLRGIIVVTIIFLILDVVPLENLPRVKKVQDLLYSSESYGFFSRINPLKDIKVLNNLKSLSTITQNYSLISQLKDTPQFQDIMNNEKIQEIIKDPALSKSLENRDISTLLTNEKFLSVLEDPELIGQIMSIDFEKSINGLD